MILWFLFYKLSNFQSINIGKYVNHVWVHENTQMLSRVGLDSPFSGLRDIRKALDRQKESCGIILPQ